MNESALKARLTLPISFDESIVNNLQSLWTSHLRGLDAYKEKLKLPDHLSEVITEINKWMLMYKILEELKLVEQH